MADAVLWRPVRCAVALTIDPDAVLPRRKTADGSLESVQRMKRFEEDVHNHSGYVIDLGPNLSA